MLPFRAFLSSMLAFSSVAYSAPSSIHNGIISATPSPTNYTIFSCDVPNAKIAEISNIKKGADYLYKRDGKARIGPGPDHCDRVSCSWNSGIFLCNMNSFAKEMEWKQIGDATELLLDRCGDDGVVKGRVDFQDNWNVVVRQDPC